MSRRVASGSVVWCSLLVLTLVSACKDLTLPKKPDPAAPGSISGRATFARPGTSTAAALAGAKVQLLGSGLETTADANGYFRLTGVRTTSGDLLLSGDTDGDGLVDHQKLLALVALHGGPGRDIAVGDVTLAQNGVVRGQVTLAGAGNHAGTLVFIPEGPFTATTSSDGSFLLSGLPEGRFSVAFFHAGYQASGVDSLNLEGGQALTLRPVELLPVEVAPASNVLTGTVVLPDRSPAAGAALSLRAAGASLDTVADATGAFTFSGIPIGVYTLVVAREGAITLRVDNLLLLKDRTTLPELVLVPGVTPDAGVPPVVDGGTAGPGTPELAGGTPRVSVVRFGPGGNPACPGAGYVLQSGLDTNGDGVLSPGEVTSSQVVCLAPSVRITPATPDVCPGGGVVLTSWVDLNLDGVYQPGEAVGAPTILCSALPPPPDAGTSAPDAGPPPPAVCAPSRLLTVDVSASPAGLATGDFNRDGRPDLATAGAALTVLLGDGDGGYVRADQPLPGGAAALVAGDLDLDGRLDLVVLADNSLLPFLGDGDGGWSPLPALPIGLPQPTGGGSVFLDDLDHDGTPDLVAYTGLGTLGVWLGTGGGAFAAPAFTTIPAYGVTGALVDLDGDGWKDLVIPFQDFNFKVVGVFPGASDGGFGAPTNLAVATTRAPGPLTAGDFTGDGRTDVVFTIDENNNGDTVVLWPNLAPGGLTPPGNVVTVGQFPAAIASGDLDGDGLRDLAVGVINLTQSGGVLQFLAGDGKGGFAPPVGSTQDPDPRMVAIADVNGDGMPDLATGNLGTTLTLRLTGGRGCPLLGNVAPIGGCPAGSVWVPGSKDATFGAPYAYDNLPQDAGIGSFCLDRHEVSEAEYMQCVNAGLCVRDTNAGGPVYQASWESVGCNDLVAGKESHPRNCVTLASANAYCGWKGQRLPTSFEWEYAARYPDGRDYPWGNAALAPDAGVCFAQPGGTCPVGTSAGDVSALGLLDLGGNLREWTADGQSHGGAYEYDDPGRLRAAVRFQPEVAVGLFVDIGFRCASGPSAGGPQAARLGPVAAPIPCTQFRDQSAAFAVACNGNTADGYYWSIGPKVAEYGRNGMNKCGSPRCDALSVGSARQVASWQLSTRWWDVAEYWMGSDGSCTTPSFGTPYACGAAHCGTYQATCAAQPLP